jgi:hypothetical protein
MDWYTVKVLAGDVLCMALFLGMFVLLGRMFL